MDGEINKIETLGIATAVCTGLTIITFGIFPGIICFILGIITISKEKKVQKTQNIEKTVASSSYVCGIIGIIIGSISILITAIIIALLPLAVKTIKKGINKITEAYSAEDIKNIIDNKINSNYNLIVDEETENIIFEYN